MADRLPVVFMALMGLAMIASIGPFWDASETRLVLGVDILLTALTPHDDSGRDPSCTGDRLLHSRFRDSYFFRR